MPEIFWRHLAWKAESSLSEDELSRKVLGPAVYTKIYCRVQRNRVLFIPVQWENRVTLTMKRIEADRQFPMIKQLPWQLAVNRGAVGESHTSGRRGKTPRGKPVSAINTVRKSQAASRWGPWKFRPSTAYGAFQPHTRAQTWVPGQWVGYSCAVPGCHNSVGQMSPGRTQLLLLTSWIRPTLASRLVKSSDSHASDPCSRLGGSSWLCYGNISFQSSMKCEKYFSRHLAWMLGSKQLSRGKPDVWGNRR